MDICTSCGNLIQSRDVHLSDGRGICAKCLPATVKTQQHVLWVNERVISILGKYGINDMPKNIPIKIVSTMELAKVQDRTEVNIMQLGLTYTKFSVNTFASKVEHQIYIIEGLHKILFAGTLAHEYLHVWQNENSISLPPFLAEGFCNIGSYVVYQSINTDLSRYLIHNLEESRDPIYGDGFRKVKEIYKKVENLRLTMECIKNLKDFNSVGTFYRVH